MELLYNQANNVGNTPLYNGNISAMKWSNALGLGDVKENAYNYGYDPMNRLKRADFKQRKSDWGLPEYKDDKGDSYTAAAYSEEDYQYDLNGNIQQLKRKTAKGEDMDVLTYDYGLAENKSNKLLSVSDTGNKTTGFIDGNTEGDDYTYDANGSMIGDKNKEISAISYNYLNLPYRITKKSGDYIIYTYEATGRKLRQQVFNSSAAQQKRSDYIGEYFYENDTLKFINHEEGRVVTTGATPEYQYFMKDHLGNVRMTFTTKAEVDSSTATMEPKNAVAESGQYLNYDEAVVLNAPLFDHTHRQQVVGPDLTHYSVLLRGEVGTTKEKYGLAKSLSVMSGDTVKMEVFAKYIDLTGSAIASEVQNVLTSIANDATPNGLLIDRGAAGSLGATAFPFIGLLSHADEPDSEAPKAYLNWVVFDRDFNFRNGGFKRVSTAAAETGSGLSQHERLAKDLVIEEAGYVYIYLSNEGESPVDVFFDDLMVQHVNGPVVQLEDYYPFGLPFNSYSRENSVSQKYKFNGKEEQTELNLAWLDFGARMYDPAIGRWMVVDPLAETARRWSPYIFGYDNPIRFIDPDGMEATDPQQKDPKEKSAQDLKKAQEGKTVQDRVKNVDNSLKKGDYIKSRTVKELANIPANKTKGEKEGTDSQRKLVDQIDKIEKTDKGYIIKLKDGQESIKGSVPLVGKDGEVKMNLDLKIENNATVNLTNNEDGSTSVDFSGIKAGKGFVKVGLPTVTIKGDEGTIMGFTVPLTK